MNTTFDKSSRQTLSGAVWLILGLLALVLSMDIKKPGFANNQDPGPQFFPILLGVLMTTGGVALCGSGLFAKWKSATHPSGALNKSETTRTKALLEFLLGFGAYIFLIPWLGFTLSSLGFGFALVWMQGSRWYVSGSMILALMIGIKLLFGMLFHVQLPEGVIGFPF
jgi:hypothetical protein